VPVLFEDDRLIAVDKPAGLVVHPAYKNKTGTLLDCLRERESAVQFRILGRLDRLTSGVVLAAKDLDAYKFLQRHWHLAQKTYVAIVHGCVEPERGEIDLRISADPGDRRRRLASATIGAPSLTQYERVDYDGESDISLVRCRLLTGRRHQIRAHFAARGWPIVGDAIYGRKGQVGQVGQEGTRHALHAWRLAFVHPAAGVRVEIEAPLPDALGALIRESRLSDATLHRQPLF